jgi:hypothetical protein
MPSIAHPRTFAPACTPEKLSLPIPLLWPFCHHLSDLEAGHVCSWLQTHAAQKTGWGLRVGHSMPTSSQQKPGPMASINIPHGGRAVRPSSPWHQKAYSPSPSPPAGPRARSLLTWASAWSHHAPRRSPSSSRCSSATRTAGTSCAISSRSCCTRWVCCDWASCSLWVAPYSCRGKAQQLCGDCPELKGHHQTQKTAFLPGRHPTREGCVQQSPRFLKSPFI